MYASNHTQYHIPRLLYSMLPSKIWRCFQVHSKYFPRYTTKYIPKYNSQQVLKDAAIYTEWYIHSHICSVVGSQDALKHTSKHAHKYVANYMTWYTPTQLGSILPSLLSKGKILPISPDYSMLTCMLLVIWFGVLQSCSHQTPSRRWCVVGIRWCMVAEIVTSVNINM